MWPNRILPVIVVALVSGCAGTHSARYVYQDGQYGVVGIPSDTSYWPTRYRKQAEALMAAHFPGGYEVIRAEEVVEGSRTLVVDGATTAMVSPELPVELLKIARIGGTVARRQSDSVKIKECRILYRRADHRDPAGGFRFTAEPTLTPTFYVDPNAAEHRHDVPRPGESAQGASKAKVGENPKGKAGSRAGEASHDAELRSMSDRQAP